jgi:hypothetical protein
MEASHRQWPLLIPENFDLQKEVNAARYAAKSLAGPRSSAHFFRFFQIPLDPSGKTPAY